MKKTLLFSLMAVLLAGFGFGGVSLANTIEVANFGELSDAFANASAGDEIVLTADIDISENAGIPVDKTLTLNLASHAINYNTNAATNDYQDLFDVEEKGDLTIDGNGTINGPTSGASYDSKVLISVSGKLTYKNGIMNAHGAGSDGMYGVYILDGGDAIFGTEDGDGPTITSHFAAIGTNNTTAPANITVYSGTYTAQADPTNSSTRWHYFCAPIYAASAGVYDIRGGTFHGFYGISSRYLHLDQSIMIGDDVTWSTTSTNLFIDSQGGTTPGNNRVIEAAVNSYTLPYGYVWVQDGDVYKVGHSVAFNSNEGSAVDAQAIVEGKYVVKPANPTKDDNVFSAWFKEVGLENERDFNSDKVMGNITLYAKWEAMISTGTAEIEQDDGTGTGMVVEVDAPATPTSLATEVQASNSTATIQGEVTLDVYNDADGNLVKDDTTPISTKVNFTSPVLVRIPVNLTGSVKVKVRHNGETTFGVDGLTTNSAATCTNGVASDPYDGAAIPVVGGYVEIFTCSASTFVAYTETANPAPRSSGGGGSSSYSCKNLPANAVANNTSKPKKNTDYSYSTDTGAVCTFQCKTGYTWNEKDAKCEKATENVADTNDTTVTENTENADTSDSASTEDLQKVLDDGFTVEFHNAYEFAFKNGITTMPTIQEADMNGNLNRIAMAKMLSQYAINVLGKTPDTTKEVPNFPDVDAQLDADYNNGVTLAYQLGIMGINIDEFRPFDLVTRAEFGTALSRMLFGIADGTELYYETHMQKLLEEKIITVANPDMHELRGYVMIMLMRSAKSE